MPQAKMAFLTTRGRPVLPYQLPQDRLGNSMIPPDGSKQIGPGSYYNDEVTSFTHVINAHIGSNKGYTLGARTGPRLSKRQTFQTPAPGHSQKNPAKCETVQTMKKPFGAAVERFPQRRKVLPHPGPGTHQHDVPRYRQVHWHQSFGGQPILMPDITLKSTLACNTNKLTSTKEEQRFYRKLAYLKLYFD